MVCLYFVHRPKKNASRMDITNDDQTYFSFAPTYGDGSTVFNRHMISVIVFSNSDTLKSMLVDYAVIEISRFDGYLDAATRAKTIRGNGINNFILHVSQCITFDQTKVFTATLISKARLKSLYSRLCFKVIRDFATSPNFKKACKQFHYESGKSKALQKQKNGLQCYLTIPRCVKIIHDNRIESNENKDVFKGLNEVPTSYDYAFRA